jgi:hypothetical protein
MRGWWLVLAMAGCDLAWDKSPSMRPDARHGEDAAQPSMDTAVPIDGEVSGLSSGTFGAATSFATDLDPMDLAIGDFNSDGRPDLAVANNKNQGSNINTIGTVSVLLGNANGTFQSAVNYTAGYGPVAIVTGDFNRDNKLDLVTMNLAQGMGGNATILLGFGNGTFGSANAVAACCSPEEVTAGDVNADGNLDLVIANYFAVQVLLGNGSGGFAAPIARSLVGVPFSVALADLNNDDKLDVVSGYNDNSDPQRVAALLGNGDGSLQTATTYTTNGALNRVLVADLDHDGKQDVITANVTTNDISVLRGTGMGTLLTPTSYAMGTTLTGGAIGDFNGDSIADVAVAAGDASSVVVRLGNGNATFGANVAYATQAGPRAVGTADFNADGRADLAVVAAGTNAVSVLLGQP